MTDQSERSLSKRTMAGAGWLVASRLVTRSIDFVSMLFLARMLMPSDFGLVGIAMTLILIVEAVLEMPVNQVLVQLRTPTLAQTNTAFTLSALRALVLATCIGLAAFPFAWIYHNPRLAPVTLCLAMAPIMRGLQSPNMAKFALRIDFRRDIVIEVTGKLAGFAAALFVAHSGGGYWALVANTVGTPAIMAVVSYVLAPYRPRVSLAEWGAFAHFIGWSSAAQVVGALSWQCDRLILANFVPLRVLGQFSLANDLSYLPEQALIKPIGRPLMAAFSLVTDQPVRLASAYARAADGLFVLGMAMMVGLSMLADPAVRFALGPKWIPAIPILSWLALSLIPPLAYAPLQALAMSVRRTDTFLYRSGLELALKLPIIALGAAFFGVYGVVAGRVAIALIMAVVAMLFIKELVGAPFWRQVARIWRTLVAGAVLALFFWFARGGLRDLSGLELGAGLAFVAAAGLIVYGMALVVLWMLAGKPEDGIEAVATQRAMRIVQRFRRAPRPIPR